MAITAKMIIAKIEMTSAFSHPQSKKCFTNTSQSISWMKEAMKPVKKAPRSAPTTVPMMTVNMASVNFALSLPTIALPDSQRNGDSMMVFTMMFTASASKLTAKATPSYWK